MMSKWLQYLILCIAIISTGLAGCSGDAGGSDPAAVVEEYLAAQVGKDENKMIGLACTEWEQGARLEYNALAALTVSLQDAACQVNSQTADAAAIGCTGKFVYNYGAEVLEVGLQGKLFRVVNQGGEWRVCGYQ